MSSLKFSVVIPTCERPEYLREALNSVLKQTLQAYEIIIVDNGYKPVNVAGLPNNKSIQVIRALPRFGVAQARNLGVVFSTGDYIAFLDDDDSWDENYLHEVSVVANTSDADIILTRLRDKTAGEPISGKQASFSDENDLKRKILRHNPGAGGSNTIIKGACLKASAGYDPFLTTNEDKALILDLLLKEARAVRASEAWVDVRNDGKGPRLTDLKKRIEGSKRFYRTYKEEMTTGTRLLSKMQLVRLYLKLYFRRGQ